MNEPGPTLTWNHRAPEQTAELPVVSVIVVSYQVRELLRACLASVFEEFAKLHTLGLGGGEVLVVDNASTDGSCEMVEREFSAVRLCRSDANLGFGVANNVALAEARGRFLLLLNSDAFLSADVLGQVLARMAATPEVGIGGVQLVGRDGLRQPSARRFHSVWRDSMVMTGLAERFPESALWGKWFGGLDRRWQNLTDAADVDWIPGAFLVLSRALVERIGVFDPRFFLYLEEVDLCQRAHRAGFRVRFWPDLAVVHIGGESARAVNEPAAHAASSQVVLWRMRSTLLYYRKWFGWKAWVAARIELILYSLRWLRNRWSSDPVRRPRALEGQALAGLMRRAWSETDGGRISPPHPW